MYNFYCGSADRKRRRPSWRTWRLLAGTGGSAGLTSHCCSQYKDNSRWKSSSSHGNRTWSRFAEPSRFLCPQKRVHDGFCAKNVRRRREIQRKLRCHCLMGGVTWAGKEIVCVEKKCLKSAHWCDTIRAAVTGVIPALLNRFILFKKNISDAILANVLGSFHLVVLNSACFTA